ncbi:MAG: hypothetical protein QW728_04580, partial [Thermoplasmata archaeon]
MSANMFNIGVSIWKMKFWIIAAPFLLVNMAIACEAVAEYYKEPVAKVASTARDVATAPAINTTV